MVENGGQGEGVEVNDGRGKQVVGIGGGGGW